MVLWMLPQTELRLLCPNSKSMEYGRSCTLLGQQMNSFKFSSTLKSPKRRLKLLEPPVGVHSTSNRSTPIWQKRSGLCPLWDEYSTIMASPLLWSVRVKKSNVAGQKASVPGIISIKKSSTVDFIPLRTCSTVPNGTSATQIKSPCLMGTCTSLAMISNFVWRRLGNLNIYVVVLR